jgi:hypothetical protein
MCVNCSNLSIHLNGKNFGFDTVLQTKPMKDKQAIRARVSREWHLQQHYPYFPKLPKVMLLHQLPQPSQMVRLYLARVRRLTLLLLRRQRQAGLEIHERDPVRTIET